MRSHIFGTYLKLLSISILNHGQGAQRNIILNLHIIFLYFI